MQKPPSALHLYFPRPHEASDAGSRVNKLGRHMDIKELMREWTTLPVRTIAYTFPALTYLLPYSTSGFCYGKFSNFSYFLYIFCNFATFSTYLSEQGTSKYIKKIFGILEK